MTLMYLSLEQHLVQVGVGPSRWTWHQDHLEPSYCIVFKKYVFTMTLPFQIKAENKLKDKHHAAIIFTITQICNYLYRRVSYDRSCPVADHSLCGASPKPRG